MASLEFNTAWTRNRRRWKAFAESVKIPPSPPCAAMLAPTRPRFGGRWLAASLGIVGLAAGLALLLLGAIFLSAIGEPIGTEAGDDIGRGWAFALILVLMALFLPLALGAGVSSLILAERRTRWLPRVALGLTAGGVACVVISLGWAAVQAR